MNRLIKGAALFALIACSIWVMVLWRWQVTARDIGGGDILTFLGALPVTVFVFALLLRWAWRGAAAGQPGRAPSTAPANPGTGHAVPSATAAPRRATVKLLAAHFVCAAGDSAAGLQAAAQLGQPRPPLDPLLRDEDGFPVTVARIADLDVEGLAPRLERHAAALRGRSPAWAGLEVSDHVVRALAALRQPLVQTLESLTASDSIFAPDTGPECASERRVRVLLGCSADWTAFEHEVARALVGDWLHHSGHPSWPGERFAVSVHTGCGEELLLQAERLLQTLARERLWEPVIVAACHSAATQAAVEALERAGVLFNGQKRPRQQIPGEAAAALLMTAGDGPESSGARPPLAYLHRPAVTRRDRSVDVAARPGSEALVQAMTEAFVASGVDADSVHSLVCDGDFHTARSPEFFAAATVQLPHLDSNEDMRLIAPVTGAAGVVSPLLVLAGSAERGGATGKPCLMLTLGDAVVRLAMVVSPALVRDPPGARSMFTNEAAQAVVT